MDFSVYRFMELLFTRVSINPQCQTCVFVLPTKNANHPTWERDEFFIIHLIKIRVAAWRVRTKEKFIVVWC